VRPLDSARGAFVLARWLGPWADERAMPTAITRDELAVPATGDRPGFRARVFRPARGASHRGFLIAPGLHFLGPDDPRMDRFCAVLAGSGAVVVAPAIPDFLALRVTPDAAIDFARAHDAARSLFPARPTLFSISFGSLLALRLAASRKGDIERAILFGGYADFAGAIRFSLTGPPPRDPLNRPVVFINLIDQLAPPAQRAPLVAAWRAYVERTWGRPEMKDPGRWQPVAHAMAAELDDHIRPLFLAGCGAAPGGDAECLAALDRMDLAFADPRPSLADVRCPVHVLHGVDDDVIPHTQAAELARHLPHARVHLTGLYAHTGRGRLRIASVARELATFTRLLRLLSASGAATIEPVKAGG
jgi:pimeloyl-ACP methyl ester carboxylesterase